MSVSGVKPSGHQQIKPPPPPPAKQTKQTFHLPLHLAMPTTLPRNRVDEKNWEVSKLEKKASKPEKTRRYHKFKPPTPRDPNFRPEGFDSDPKTSERALDQTLSASFVPPLAPTVEKNTSATHSPLLMAPERLTELYHKTALDPSRPPAKLDTALSPTHVPTQVNRDPVLLSPKSAQKIVETASSLALESSLPIPNLAQIPLKKEEIETRRILFISERVSAVIQFLGIAKKIEGYPAHYIVLLTDRLREHNLGNLPKETWPHSLEHREKLNEGIAFFKVERYVASRERTKSWGSPKSAGKRSSGKTPPFVRPLSCPPYSADHEAVHLSKEFSPGASDSPDSLASPSPERQDGIKDPKSPSSPDLLTPGPKQTYTSPQADTVMQISHFRFQKPAYTPPPPLVEDARSKPSQVTVGPMGHSPSESIVKPPSSSDSFRGIALIGLADLKGRRSAVVLNRTKSSLV